MQKMFQKGGLWRFLALMNLKLRPSAVSESLFGSVSSAISAAQKGITSRVAKAVSLVISSDIFSKSYMSVFKAHSKCGMDVKTWTPGISMKA